MTIQKDRPWGEPGGLPAGGVLVRSDAELRSLVERARRAGQELPTVGLLGGDLCRTLGGTGDEGRIRSAEAMRLPVDLGTVMIDGRINWFVAHLVARRSWWHGRVVAAMNAQFLGRWDVAPRSHPNDGLLDVLDSDLPIGDRFKARSRLPLGTHVPHPGIAQSRVGHLAVDLDRPTPVYLDGERVGSAGRLTIRIEADALVCVV